jgi:NADH:ubiquinone oxidoreductase subunit C
MEDFPVELMELNPEKHSDGWWVTAAELDVRQVAQVMLTRQVRLVTMTATARPGGETDVIYHYAAAGVTYNLKTTTRANSLPSISVLLPAANWIEREIHDLFAVQFEGHPNLARLVRPPETPEGFYRQPGGAASREKAPAPERKA